MRGKSITIIGSGLSGLSAGCYAQMVGLKATIIERNSYHGGYCVSWPRGPYSVNGCVHWAWGFNPSSPNYKVWKALGVIDKVKFIKFDRFREVVFSDNRKFIVKANINELKSDLMTVAPDADKAFTESFLEDLKSLSSFYEGVSMDSRTEEWTNQCEKYRKYSKKVKEIMTENVIDPEYRKLLTYCFDVHGIGGIYSFFNYSHVENGDVAYPIGGSSMLTNTMLQTFQSLGGSVQYNSQINKILIENGESKGVELSDGTKIKSDFVLTTANVNTNNSKLIGLSNIHSEDIKPFMKYEMQPAIMQVVLGFKGDLVGTPMPSNTSFLFNEPYTIAGKTLPILPVKFNYDTTLCPKGKSLLLLLFPADWKHWLDLQDKPEKYIEERMKVKQVALNQIAKILPNIGKDIEMIDIATPLTYARKANAYDGSALGYYLTPDGYSHFFAPTQYSWKGLKHLYKAGLSCYTQCAITTSTMTGRGAIRQLCKENGIQFPYGL